MKTTILHDAPNEEPITELWAWLSFDKHGNEGIIAKELPDLGVVPLITSKKRVAEQMRRPAEEIGRLSKQRVVLVRFARVADA